MLNTEIMVNNMNEKMYRRNVEKMTNSEWIAFVNEKVQEMDILQKILKEQAEWIIEN